MNKRLLLLLLPIFLSLSILFLTISPAYSVNDSTDPVHNPETGNYYQFVQDIGISWVNAESSARELSHNGFIGQLAVITTQDENDFITDLLPDESSTWIGLKASDGGFKWINEETFDYSNWSSYQPTNGDYEDYVELFEYNGKWNDIVNGNHDITGYVVEYILTNPDPTCNSGNSPNINPVEHNGHYYLYIHNGVEGQDNDPAITWDYVNEIAESLCYEGRQGHLVTFTDEEENDFVTGLISGGDFAIIGLHFAHSEEELKWVTGEPFEYSNFASSAQIDEGDDIIVMIHHGPWTYLNGYGVSLDYRTAFVVEFSP